jgi:hypothetical protein
MLIGTKNNINEKLLEEVSQLVPVQFVEYKDFLNSSSSEISVIPNIVIVNLMDVGPHEEAICKLSRNRYPESKLIAIHCFLHESMIVRTLDKGYDAYFSIFKLSEELPAYLKSILPTAM